MAKISAADVKELRNRTGAGMMDCKEALEANDGDIEAAVDWLRKKGLAAAAKKAGRVAAEGLVGIATGGGAGAIVEVNSETDFVARNETFQDFVRTVADLALSNDGDMDAVLESGYPGTDRTVSEQLTHNIATIGENMSIRRTASVSVSPGVVGSYVHNTVTDSLGKIGVLVALESEGDEDKLATLGKQLSMHIAAANPQSLDIEGLSGESIARERDVLVEQARESGKPDNIIEKMIEGRMRKFYEQVVLLKQTYIIDGERNIETVLKDAEKDVGAPVKIVAFVRFGLGEGIEKEEEDFASEVQAAAGA